MNVKSRVFGFVIAATLAACGKGGAADAPLVRVQIPELKCEVAIPSNMEIVDAKPSGFWIVEKGKNKMDGMLIAITPVGPMPKASVPPDATDVKSLKDKTNPDGSVEREGSYKNKYQTLHTAEYAFPLGKEWIHCNISAALPARRDEVAKLCSTLAPKAL